MEKKFTRVRSKKDIIIFTSLIIIGLTLATIPNAEGVNFGGYILTAVGVAIALLFKSAYKDSLTKEIYLRKEFTFAGDMKSPILAAIAAAPRKIDLTQEGKGQAVRLEMFYSKKTGKAYLQLFEYIPYQYEQCSEMHEHSIEEVEKLLK